MVCSVCALQLAAAVRFQGAGNLLMVWALTNATAGTWSMILLYPPDVWLEEGDCLCSEQKRCLDLECGRAIIRHQRSRRSFV